MLQVVVLSLILFSTLKQNYKMKHTSFAIIADLCVCCATFYRPNTGKCTLNETWAENAVFSVLFCLAEHHQNRLQEKINGGTFHIMQGSLFKVLYTGKEHIKLTLKARIK